MSGTAYADLNVYYVLVMNEDNTISVVDPLFGFGGSKLLSYVRLDTTTWAVVASTSETLNCTITSSPSCGAANSRLKWAGR
jgi:hypothetical protein